MSVKLINAVGQIIRQANNKEGHGSSSLWQRRAIDGAEGVKNVVKVQVLVTCTVMFSGAVVAVFVVGGTMGHSIIHTLSRNKVV